MRSHWIRVTSQQEEPHVQRQRDVTEEQHVTNNIGGK